MTKHFLDIYSDKRDDTRDAAHAVYSQIILAVNMIDHLYGSGIQGSDLPQAAAITEARSSLGDAAQKIAQFIRLRLS